MCISSLRTIKSQAPHPSIAQVVILAVGWKVFKHRLDEGIRRHAYVIFAQILLLVLIGFNVLVRTGACEEIDVQITDFFPCDRLGNPQDYFPIKTTVYFNISVRNFSSAPENVTIYITVQDHTDVPIGLDQLNIIFPPSTSKCSIMSVLIPEWARVGFATAWATVFVEGRVVDSASTEFYIGPEDMTPPLIHLLSPENVTYESVSISLIFTVDEKFFWLGYSLNHQENVTITMNTSIAGLTSGPYSIVVYANDTSGNMGSSDEVCFEILIIHDVAVTDVRCSPTKVYIGQTLNITVSVENQGILAETIYLSVHANTNDVGTMTIPNLSNGSQTIVDFTWNTTNFAKGNYTISATADAVLNETDTADNTYVDGTVNVIRRPDIMVTNVVSLKTSIGQGYSTLINATFRNKGDYTEVFNITVYANTTVVQTETATLTRGDSSTITFQWNTIALSKGNYTISAVAWPVIDEIDTTDNTFVNGWGLVTIPGDVDGDRAVDIIDIIRLIDIYHISQPDPLYDPNCDIDNDGDIDIFDIVISTENYGKNWSS